MSEQLRFAAEDLALQMTHDSRCTCSECGRHATISRPLFLAACGWLCERCWSALCADD